MQTVLLFCGLLELVLNGKFAANNVFYYVTATIQSAVELNGSRSV